MNYNDFLKTKEIRVLPSGFNVEEGKLNPAAFDWQRHVVSWALKRGKAALFEDCGLGKTLQQLMWAEQVCKYIKRPVLIVAPLAVSLQTKREGEKFGIAVNICESQANVREGINITNYEKLEKFDATIFGGVVLDESSILKSYMGKTKRMIIEKFAYTPYKLACTATPAPNDLMETCREGFLAMGKLLGSMYRKTVRHRLQRRRLHFASAYGKRRNCWFIKCINSV